MFFEAVFGFVFIVTSATCVNVSAQNVIGLFAHNGPDYVNVSDVKSSVQQLVYELSDRLLCKQHGLEPHDCAKCFNTYNDFKLLALDPSDKKLTRENAKDLSVLFLHLILKFRTLCRSEPYGCGNFDACQQDVLDIVHAADLRSSLDYVLRNFQSVLAFTQEDKCFGVDELMQELSKTPGIMDDKALVRQVVTLLMGHILQGHCINIEASTTAFLDDIFHMYGDHCFPVITLDGLKRLVSDLQSNGQHDHNHDHPEHDNDHNHKHDHSSHPECLHDHDHSSHHHHEHDHSDHGSNHVDHNLQTQSDHSHKIHGSMDGKHDHKDHHHSHEGHEHEDHHHNHEGHEHEDHQHHDHPEDVNGELMYEVSNDVQNLKPGQTHVHHQHEDDHTDHLDHPININYENQNSSLHAHDHSDHLPGIDNSRNESMMLSGLNTTTDETSNFDEKDDESYILDNNQTFATTTVIIPVTSSNIRMNETFLDDEDILDDFKKRAKREESTERQLRPPPSDGDFTISTETERSPASSWKTDLYHQEVVNGFNQKEQKDLDAMMEDVRRVYLLKNQGRHMEAEFAVPSLSQNHANLASKCLGVEELVAQFRFSSNNSLSKDEFLQICPAIVQQVVSGACHRRRVSQQKPPTFELYLYSCISVLIISLTSLGGVVLLPILTKQAYHYVMAACYGLAFSTLAGDAFIHLLPQVLGVHSHGSEEEGHHSHGEETTFDPIMLKMLGIMAAIYVLYLFEAIICAFSKDSHQSKHQGKSHGHTHMPESLPKELTLISVKTKSETQLTLSRDSASSLDTEVVEDNKKPPNLMVSNPIFLGMTSLALVITLGDSIHNFGDGLAIGAAFSASIRGGLSTSIAVLCHELPHEFGDFVILLSTGLSFSKALLINFLSGLTCFAGLFIGIVIGDDENARKWVMALTAGIFLYVALTELLPELKEHKKGSPTKILLMKNFGILGGVLIMVVISIYEHKISIDAF